MLEAAAAGAVKTGGMEALFSEYAAITKSGLFDPEYYLATYPDVAARNVDPLVHYLEEGAAEGRNPNPEFDAAFYLEQCETRSERPANPLLHYLRLGMARGLPTRGDGSTVEPSGRRDGQPSIVIAVEALEVTGGAERPSHLEASGWALAPAPIAEIAVLLDGALIGRAVYGLPRPDVARLFPQRKAAGRSGFALTLDLPAGAIGAVEPLLRVRLADGAVAHRPLRVEIPADGAPPRIHVPPLTDDRDGKLQIDTPRLIDGAVETPVRGNLEISGWALARAGVAAIEIAIDDETVALADYGLRRPDVPAAYPDWEEAQSSGWQALLPHRRLPAGRHCVSVTLRDKAGGSRSAAFAIEVEAQADATGPWSLRRKIGQAEIDLNRRLVARRGSQPSFVLLLPVGGDKRSLAKAQVTVGSLPAQAYPEWRLVIVPRGRARPEVLRARLIADAGLPAEKAEVMQDPVLPAMVGDSAPGDRFVAVLTAGDELGVDALLEMAVAAAQYPDADFLYSDERCLSPASGTVEAFFKPQWSPDLLLSMNYIGRLWCARGDLLRQVLAPDEAVLGHGEYDLVLRCTERAAAIRHVAAVLCESGGLALDPPGAEKQALERTLARRGIAGAVQRGRWPGTWRVQRAVQRPGRVSIIIPTCAAEGRIETCIATLRRNTHYPDYEIVCIENIPATRRKWRRWLHRHADRVIRAREPFNWSRFNNLAAAEAEGEFLLFLNDDIEITDGDWLDALIAEAQRPEVGVVGPRLLYPDGRVQHAGMFLAAPGQARHAFRYLAPDEPGYFGLALSQRNVIAVTGACLTTRRDTYDSLGGFDEAHAIINNDLDFCLRAWQRGLLNVYTPAARLVHHEKVSRGALDEEYDVAAFASRWRDLFVAGDPYFSPHLSKQHDDFVVDDEPSRLSITGGPALSRESIRKILAVKLDHIGDCMIALPAIRRLKQHFPDAGITVLTSRTSKPVWLLEPAVDEVLEFDFFHPRSEMGELELTEEDWRKLREMLAPCRFDLAVDLRKHPDTRPILQHTGAHYLAGFDWRNRYPWLDVALEWTGDLLYAKKHRHNGEDLVNLVDAIAFAGEADRSLIAVRPSAAPAPARRLGGNGASGPLVYVHPAAGNAMKQWPQAYFATVIDRLIEQDGARIVLIGGPEDAPLAEDLRQRVRRSDAVVSLAGKVPLGELPALLAGASLFLGNDSGPKHIAAGLGVPTVGIHGGTVDLREWGPVGPNAVAIARDVVCSPCYLSKIEDCRRGLACLRQLEPGPVYEACKRLLLLAATAETVKHPTGHDASTAGRGEPARARPPRRVARAVMAGPAG